MKGGNGGGSGIAIVDGLENLGRRLEIEWSDLELRSWGCDVRIRIGSGAQMELGIENRMGNLKFMEGISENCDIQRFRQEEAQYSYTSATRHRLAPAELGTSNRAALGLDWRRVGHGSVK